MSQTPIGCKDGETRNFYWKTQDDSHVGWEVSGLCCVRVCWLEEDMFYAFTNKHISFFVCGSNKCIEVTSFRINVGLKLENEKCVSSYPGCILHTHTLTLIYASN